MNCLTMCVCVCVHAWKNEQSLISSWGLRYIFAEAPNYVLYRLIFLYCKQNIGVGGKIKYIFISYMYCVYSFLIKPPLSYTKFELI